MSSRYRRPESETEELPEPGNYRYRRAKSSGNRTPLYIVLLLALLVLPLIGTAMKPIIGTGESLSTLWLTVLAGVLALAVAVIAFAVRMPAQAKLFTVLGCAAFGYLALIVVLAVRYMPLTSFTDPGAEEFSAEFPGHPTETADAATGVTRYFYPKGSETYSVNFAELDEQTHEAAMAALGKEADFAEAFFGLFGENGSSKVRWEVNFGDGFASVSERDYEDGVGRRVYARDGGVMTIADLRLIGRKLFVVAVEGPGINVNAARVDKFLRSFKFKAKPSKREPNRPGGGGRPSTPGGIVEPPSADTESGNLVYIPLDGDSTGVIVHGPERYEPSIVRGQCLHLTEPGHYFTLPPDPELNWKDGDGFTIAFWVKTTQQDGTIFSWRSSTNPDTRIEIGIKGGMSRARAASDTAEGKVPDWIEGPMIGDGIWHHIAVVRYPAESPRRDTFQMFIDGAPYFESHLVSGPITTDLRVIGMDAAKIGKTPTGPESYVGRIDELAIFNRRLSESDIAKFGGRGW